MAYQPELDVALDAAEAAGAYLLREYDRFEKIPDAAASLTTDADRQSQEIILQAIRQAFPADALCAEEATEALAGAAQAGDRLWIVDPIDGTRGFAKKIGEFSVMVAFVDRGQVAAGVVLEPAKRRLTYAAAGGGCWKRDGAGAAEPCRVSRVTDLTAAALVESRPKDPAPTPPVRAVQPARVVQTYSAGIKMAMVARGEVELYVNTYAAFHDWDIAAGHVLVEEAGGRSTGLAGEELRYGLAGAWQRAGLLASNGLIHEAALAALKQMKRG